MNYQDFVTTHRKTGADITVAALPTDEKQATAFGLMKIDGTGRIQVVQSLLLDPPCTVCMTPAYAESAAIALADVANHFGHESNCDASALHW